MKKVLITSFFLIISSLHAEQNTWGVEVNPFRLLLLTGDSSSQTFSGTVSHFDHNNGVEIAMPIYFSKDKNDYEGTNYTDTQTILDIDLHYRKYFDKNIKGAYVGGFGRYTYLDGKEDYSSRYATVNKFGLGVEVGFRVRHIFDTPFYWGASLAYGVYLGDSNNIFNTSRWDLELDDSKYIVDLELLKVGYEF